MHKLLYTVHFFLHKFTFLIQGEYDKKNIVKKIIIISKLRKEMSNIHILKFMLFLKKQ